MLKDPTEFRKRFAAWKEGAKPYQYGIPYEDDNHNTDYDQARANQLGYERDNKGHLSTRDVETGRFLKSPAHPTVSKAIWGDMNMGYDVWYNDRDGQFYSQPGFFESRQVLPRYKNGKSEWDDSTDFITKYEGFSDTTYQKKGDVPTIGYGTTNKKWTSKGKITVAQARQAMAEDLAANEGLLRKNIVDYDRLPDSAKTVLRDILYNVGSGNLFSKSPKFMQALNARNYEEAARQMDWDNNKPGFGGARKRNAARQELFLKDLRSVKPVSQFVSSLEERPEFEPIQIEVPVDRTDFSLQNASIQSPAPRKLNVWTGSQSPAYGGASVRMPSMQEYMSTKSIMPVVY